MPRQPLAEVFGFPIDNFSSSAVRYRKNKLCPYNNRVPNCTKDKAKDPLGVCSVFHGERPVITCPVRFREEWLIADDAAKFFFPDGVAWTSLTEVRLNDKNGKSAGNIDVVLVSYDERGRILDFGALEVQAVYISGNVSLPFKYYMEDPAKRCTMDWAREPLYPRPDYLSSSRKRLAPQLIFKGGIFNAWNRKMTVALDSAFFNTLPVLSEVESAVADIAWMIYDLQFNETENRYTLQSHKTIYTKFEEALHQITKPEPGEMSVLMRHLQRQLDAKMGSVTPPDNATIEPPF